MSEKYKPTFQDAVSEVDINSIPTPDSLRVSDRVRREVDGDIFSALSDLDMDGFNTKGKAGRAD